MAKLLLTIIVAQCSLAGGIQFGGSTSVGDAVAHATAPLHQEVVDLKYQLEVFEARHDTLEAATEQFRLKSKGLKEKLESEKERYISLMSSKNSDEKKHKEETKKVQKELRDSIGRATSLERSLEIVMTDDKERQLAHQKEAEQWKASTNEMESHLQQLQVDKENLQNILHKREQELSQFASQEARLKEEVAHMKERVRDMEKKTGTFWIWFQENILESSVLSATSQACASSSRWLWEEALPSVVRLIAIISEIIKSSALVIVDQLLWILGGIASLPAAALAAAATSNATRNTELPLNGPFLEESMQTTTVHKWLNNLLVSGAIAMQKHAAGEESLKWMTDLSTVLISHGQAIVIGAEVLFALLLIDFAISSLFPSKAQPRLGLRPISAGVPAGIAAPSGGKATPAPKQMVSHGSLLRRSGHYTPSLLDAETEEDTQTITSWERRNQRFAGNSNW